MSGLVIDETKPGQPRYIESTSKKWYRSVVPPGNMRLKKKLITGGSARKQNQHSDNNQKRSRNKLSESQKKNMVPQPRMVKVVIDLNRGTSRMMTVEQFAALSWGWEI